MAKRTPNHRLVKINRSYTVEEIARLFGMHKNTVRRWTKEGLATVDNKRPLLVLGHVLAAFLQARRAKSKKKCQPGELYCVCCRSPKAPAADMVDYAPINEKVGTLKAICPDCGVIMNRHVSLAKIGQVRGKMEITFPEALRPLIESNKPTVNSDLR